MIPYDPARKSGTNDLTRSDWDHSPCTGCACWPCRCEEIFGTKRDLPVREVSTVAASANARRPPVCDQCDSLRAALAEARHREESLRGSRNHLLSVVDAVNAATRRDQNEASTVGAVREIILERDAAREDARRLAEALEMAEAQLLAAAECATTAGHPLHAEDDRLAVSRIRAALAAHRRETGK